MSKHKHSEIQPDTAPESTDTVVLTGAVQIAGHSYQAGDTLSSPPLYLRNKLRGLNLIETTAENLNANQT